MIHSAMFANIVVCIVSFHIPSQQSIMEKTPPTSPFELIDRTNNRSHKNSSKSIKINMCSNLRFLNPYSFNKNIYFCTCKLRHEEGTDRGQLLLLSVCCPFVVRSLSVLTTNKIRIKNMDRTAMTWTCYLPCTEPIKTIYTNH